MSKIPIISCSFLIVFIICISYVVGYIRGGNKVFDMFAKSAIERHAAHYEKDQYGNNCFKWDIKK